MATGRYGVVCASWSWLMVGMLALPATSRAQDAASEAREHFLEGVQMADEQRWAEAVQHFRQSRALMDRDSTVFNLAVALFRLGRYGESVQAFEDFLRMTDGDAGAARARAEAQSFMRKAESSMARVTLEVEPANARISVDGEAVDGQGPLREMSLDPGLRRLRVEAPNHLPQTLKLSLLSGSEATTRVELVPLMGDLASQREESARRAAEAQAVADGRGVSFAGGEGPADADGERRPLIKSPWFWVAAGAVVIAAGVGLGVGLSGGGGGADPYGGTTGVVLRP